MTIEQKNVAAELMAPTATASFDSASLLPLDANEFSDLRDLLMLLLDACSEFVNAHGRGWLAATREACNDRGIFQCFEHAGCCLPTHLQ